MVRSRSQKLIGYVTEAWISDEQLADLGIDFVNAYLARCFWQECRAANLTLAGEPEITRLDPARSGQPTSLTAYRVSGRVVKHIGRPFKH